MFGRFGIRANSPLDLYRGSEALPLIVPGLVWHYADQEGHPWENPELTVAAVSIPRTYVLDEY